MAISGGQRPKARIDAAFLCFIGLVLASVTLLFAGSFVVPIRDAGLSLFSGARGGIYKAFSLRSRARLSAKEQATLQEEYDKLKVRVIGYERLERNAAEILQENIRLREQLGFSQSLNDRYIWIPAEIIGKDPNNLFSALVINKGKHSGVADNMAVIAYQDGIQGLVGKVIQAGASESHVMPLYDTSSFISSIPSRLAISRYDGIVEGQGDRDGPLRMRNIPKRARDEINPGDMIVSKGTIGGVYPTGINIGRVTDISYQENETFMEVNLESVIDFSRLENVFVIAEKEEETDEEANIEGSEEVTGD